MKNKIPTSFFSKRRFGVIAVLAFVLLIVSVVFISEWNRNPFKDFPDAVVPCKWGNVTKFISQKATAENISTIESWKYCNRDECHNALDFYNECNNKGVKLMGDLNLSQFCPSCNGECGCQVSAEIMGINIRNVDSKLLNGKSLKVMKGVTVEGTLYHNGEPNYSAAIDNVIIY